MQRSEIKKQLIFCSRFSITIQFLLLSIQQFLPLSLSHSRCNTFFALFFCTLQIYLFFYTNYLGIVIFSGFSAFNYSRLDVSHLCFSLLTCNLQAKYIPFIQIVEMINAFDRSSNFRHYEFAYECRYTTLRTERKEIG